MFLDRRAHALRRHQGLGVISVEQKRGKLLAAKTRRDVAGAQFTLDDYSHRFERLAADEMAVGIIY